MKLRRAIGGWLVRLGQRIARPTVTVEPLRFPDDAGIRSVIDEMNAQSREYAQEYLQRRESRGWN